MGNSVFNPAKILLPETEQPDKWPVLACDQFTSQPEYWQQTAQIAGEAPSTLRVILPEVYLEAEDVDRRIADIHTAMDEYIAEVLLREVEGYIYIRRSFADGSVREGLVGAVDLESYSYEPGAACAIRPSENTVVERIPPRLAVRQEARLESPHILMLIDDESESVIEPLAGLAQGMPLYDIQLMQGGGRLQGWAVTDAKALAAVAAGLAALEDAAKFRARYGADESVAPFLFAVGDGNHSLATAKAHWEELKPALTEAERATHPARYCLVELENIQSPAINIEPIHRVVFDVDPATLLHRATVFAAQSGAKLAPGTGEGHPIAVLVGGKRLEMRLQGSAWPLAVAAVEAFLDSFIHDYPSTKVDYVHGEDAVEELSRNERTVGILLPPFAKSDLFRGVALGGVLPRKTFSMGHAEQKRYYMECRRIDK